MNSFRSFVKKFFDRIEAFDDKHPLATALIMLGLIAVSLFVIIPGIL